MFCKLTRKNHFYRLSKGLDSHIEQDMGVNHTFNMQRQRKTKTKTKRERERLRRANMKRAREKSDVTVKEVAVPRVFAAANSLTAVLVIR